ncbi:hypothetical protein BC629DRAFT_318372 [Irpex lacteus]|nr:hypothetical protein BC629DRAFT_318372 [Irpex lacteus]
MSQPVSPTSPTPATQTFSTPGRRRGSILVAASDALSSFARKTPMRSLHLNMGGIGRTNSTKSFATTAQPIILTEVIEISESAVRASKRREEEEEERERLREAAARALGINDKEGDASSMNSRQRSGLLDIEEPGEEEDVGNGEYRGWGDDSVTPTATSLPGLPPAPTHSRTRSSSYIPPHTLASLPARSSTPLSTFSSQHASQQHSTSVSTHPLTPKSFSTPPSSVAPTLRINTFNSSKSYPDDTLSGPLPEIPPFPSTPAALTPFTQLSATLPRYYPAPSLLMFTLTKQWKNRYLVFTSPLISPSSQKAMFRSPLSSDSTSATTPVPSYLHLFKTDGKEEKEIERLEINEESVVYVAEGEVGGRKGVIKVGGSLKKKPSTVTVRRPSTSGTATSVNAPTASSRTSSSSMGSVEEPVAEGGVLTNFENASTSSNGQSVEGRTMWVVQITDPEEAQEWIGAIKGAVLNQR